MALVSFKYRVLECKRCGFAFITGAIYASSCKKCNRSHYFSKHSTENNLFLTNNINEARLYLNEYTNKKEAGFYNYKKVIRNRL